MSCVNKLLITHKCTCTGVEKNNDDCRRIHLHKSNKWDAATDVLLVSKRLETLSDCQRTPREYKKRNDDYWMSGIKEKRAKLRLSKMPSNIPSERGNQSVDNMSPSEIRNILKEMGIRTRVRNVKRLQEMYSDALNAVSEI